MSERNIHEGLPIGDDDAVIAAALEDVSIPTLLLSLVHMTGDPKPHPEPVAARRLLGVDAGTRSRQARDRLKGSAG